MLWLDVAKGFCMLSVMAGHLSNTAINRVVFAYHLTVFFILAGYTLKTDLTTESLAKRFRSLMVPYFITCACIVAMNVVNLVVFDGVTAMGTITKSVAKNLLISFMASGTRTNFGTIEIGSMIGAIWFLPAMFFAVVTAQLLLKALPVKRDRYLIGGLLSVLSHISAQFLWLPFSIQAGIFVAPFLLLGYDLRQCNLLEKLRWPHVLLCLGLFLVGILGGWTKIYFVTTTVSDLLISTVVTLCASGAVIYLSKKVENCRFLGWIGKNSIYFLCIHAFDIAVMGRWFKACLGLVGLKYTFLAKFLIRLVFALAVTGLLLLRKKLPKRERSGSQRDPALDVAKGLLISLMLLGHFTMDASLRKIIYSFHMAAFIFYSGYCYRSGRPLGKYLLKAIRSSLIPYLVFGVFYVLLMDLGTKQELKNLLFCMSFSKGIFKTVDSIGPVYFILMLLLTKVIYALLDKLLRGEVWLFGGVLVLSLAGWGLAVCGLWLPWSLDCALYSLIFYYLGAKCKQYNFMDYFHHRPWSYFLLSPIWVYMIYKGSMEIAIRKYGPYGLVIIGAVCACVLLYQLCRYLSGNLPRPILWILCRMGESTLYILIVHRLLNSRINGLLRSWLTPGHLWHTLAMVMTQLLLGTLIALAIAWTKTAFQKLRKDRINNP